MKRSPRSPRIAGAAVAQDRQQVRHRITPHRAQLRLHGLSVNFERKRDGRIITLHAENSLSASSRTDESNE